MMTIDIDREFKKYFNGIDYNYIGDFKCDQKEAFEAGWNAARQWQPIESAPKDGTSILFVDKNRVVDICWWLRYSKGWGSTRSIERDEYEIPTHWMPMPEPPKDVK